MWQTEMVEKLKAATPRERKAVLAPYSEMTGYSVPYLYEVAAEFGWSSGRKKRNDAGACETDFTPTYHAATSRSPAPRA